MTPLAILPLLLMACAAHAQNNPAFNFAPVQARAQTVVSNQNLPGAVLLLTRRGETVFSRSFGGYSADTRVPIASASKWLSAALLAALVERSLMQWDDPVSRYFPNAPADKRKITLRQLFSHTSGLPRPESPCLGDTSSTLRACANQILLASLAYPPGGGFAYGGNAMQLAGAMAEVATGRRFDDLFIEYVVQPLGLNATDFATGSSQPGYVLSLNPRVAGGARSSARDLSRFVQMMAQRGVFEGRQVLSGASIDRLSEDEVGNRIVYSTPLPGAGYGLGVWRELSNPSGQATLVSSPGAFGTWPWIDRETGVGGVFLTVGSYTQLRGEAQGITRDVRAIVKAATNPSALALTVGSGGGSGESSAGRERHVFARFPAATSLFDGWEGDSPVLRDPRAWHATLTMPARDVGLNARFVAGPDLAPVELSVNGTRALYQAPSSPVRGLLLRFHGSGGSANGAFSGAERGYLSRLALHRGFLVASLDSVNRTERQWNPSFSLSNPDVQNVQALIAALQSRGLIAQGTPVFAEGTSNGGGFASRVSALLSMRAQALVISTGIQAIVTQASVSTIFSLARRDSIISSAGIIEAQASSTVLRSRRIASELNVLEPSPLAVERLTRISGVTVAAAQVFLSNLRGAGWLDAEDFLVRSPLGRPELALLLPAALAPFSGEVSGALEIAWAEHHVASDFAHRIVHFFEAALGTNLTGTWWNENQPGWGLTISQQGQVLVPGWFTYDREGRPVWYAGGGLLLQPDGSYSGPAFGITGEPFAQINGPVNTVGAQVGTLTINPLADGRIGFNSVISGIAQTRTLTPVGARPICRTVTASRLFAPNRSDVWWNPLEPGWGTTFTEQGNSLTLGWYTYGAQGRAQWIAATLERAADGSFSGPLNRPAFGVPFDQIVGAATTLPLPQVGSATLVFASSERAEFRYTLDGISQSKPLQRFAPGSAWSDCM